MLRTWRIRCKYWIQSHQLPAQSIAWILGSVITMIVMSFYRHMVVFSPGYFVGGILAMGMTWLLQEKDSSKSPIDEDPPRFRVRD